VNVTGLKRLLDAMLKEKPDAMLLNGDLVGGGETEEEEASQFQTFLKVMQPAYDAGIKVLTVRGNHEMHCPNADDVWRKAMSGPYANPSNGPAKEQDLTYTFTLKNCMFIALDEFKTSKPIVNQPGLMRCSKRRMRRTSLPSPTRWRSSPATIRTACPPCLRLGTR